MKLLPPALNFDALKAHVMNAMESATRHAVMNCRDLIGGDNRNHFEPLLKLFDSLLVIGLFDDSELEVILSLIHPASFDSNSKILIWKLNKLIWRQLKPLKKTKEFRCPPKEQMFRLLKCKATSFSISDEKYKQGEKELYDKLNFDKYKCTGKVKEEKEDFLDDEVEYDQCPMAESLQEQLRDFCSLLVAKIGNVDEYNDEQRQDLIRAEEGSWVDSLARLVVAVPPPPPTSDKELIARNGTRKFREVIVTMLREWALGHFIESSELIRKMFNLLLRQYSGVRELQDAMSQTYVLHERNNDDVKDFIIYLIQIRELLTVQFEHTEEAILKRGLWSDLLFCFFV
ncbi:hypothetical protein DICVIV_00329 [Dictyocaulus viviparus]|uniref:Ryanodine receptor junctional solenoid domain-containing protein n=1 Tax=Dictyocaulus viviparus TaxID=29172 RepID=A0A0D8YFH0_DICVI|nr:hypothetical protein DICVIV_00329 [Dictyocaulus viviparus]